MSKSLTDLVGKSISGIGNSLWNGTELQERGKKFIKEMENMNVRNLVRINTRKHYAPGLMLKDYMDYLIYYKAYKSGSLIIGAF